MNDEASIRELDGVREKLIRANEHLHALRTEVAEYVVTAEFGIRQQFEERIPEKSGRSGLTFRADLKMPPPLRISAIAGDCVHNLRSVLDHLAWALVERNGGTPHGGPGGTQFPILDRLSDKGKVRPIRVEGGISDEAAFLLERLQPYQRVEDPTQHALSILNRLSNVDKHRTLNMAAVDLGRVVIRIGGTTGTARARPFEDGALIFWFLSEREGGIPEGEIESEYAPSIAFKDAGIGGRTPVPAEEVLEGVLDYVRREVVEPFSVLCFGGPLDLSRLDPIF